MSFFLFDQYYTDQDVTGRDVMKFSSIVMSALIPFSLVNAVIAGPSQRLIVQFDTSLSAEHKQTLNEQIKSIIKTDYGLLPHSTDRRWIIVITPALNELELGKAIEDMLKLDHVKYAEPDNVLKVFR